jgi:hypothetical protein
MAAATVGLRLRADDKIRTVLNQQVVGGYLGCKALVAACEHRAGDEGAQFVELMD